MKLSASMKDQNYQVIKTTSSLKMDIKYKKSEELKSAIIKYFKNEITEIPLNLYEGVEELSNLNLSGRSIKKCAVEK